MPRDPRQQEAWNREIQDAYGATLRASRPDMQQGSPSEDPAIPAGLVSGLKQLAQLHRSGALTDEEFTAAKTKLLSSESV
jgi:hypothetical protein